jgi:hypothetical protein
MGRGRWENIELRTSNIELRRLRMNNEEEDWVLWGRLKPAVRKRKSGLSIFDGVSYSLTKNQERRTKNKKEGCF